MPHLNSSNGQIEVTVLMPCLNEAETLPICIHKAHTGCYKAGHSYEILIADNGSTDGSPDIAQSAGARVIRVPVQGYGAALWAGIQAARGRFIIMGDSDDSYDFSEITCFIEKWREGHELIMGTRLRGEIKPGAMPFLHRWLGNPILTGIGNLFFQSKFSDYHCGLRGFDRQAILNLNLCTTGMEFASEMVIKAAMAGLKTTEIPVTLSPDGRSRRPHLRTWRDGWRHLRFMLLYSPRWLFLYPGIALFILGVLVTLILLPAPLQVASVVFDVHTLAIASIMILVGAQMVSLGGYAQMFAARVGLLKLKPSRYALIQNFSLEIGIALGVGVALLGILVDLYAFWGWSQAGFGPLNYEETLRIVIPGSTLIGLGVQIFFSSFMISILDLK
jgi:glycosyltransferase involved in cell wall biosynthesis